MEKPEPLPPHVLQKLNEANWEAIIRNLGLYAKRKASSLYWRSGNRMDLAKGMNPEDLVNEAIVKVFEGTRIWDPVKYPDLEKFLKNSVLDSMFNELAESVDNATVERFPQEQDADGTVLEPTKLAPPEAKHAYELTRRTANPEEILLAKEEADQRELQAKEIVAALLETAQDDSDVTKLLECMLEGITAPRHIAQHTGKPISQINNAQKRLGRMVEKIKSDLLKQALQTKGAP